jgi:hypothetical protein
MKALFFTILASILSYNFAQAQSISGNFNTTFDGETVVLKYGNVDIFNKKNELVKSLITDELGNFSAKLDTGTYTCVVNYSGFAPIKKMIIVNSDEKMDFVAAETDEGRENLRKELVKDRSRSKAEATSSSMKTTGEVYEFSVKTTRSDKKGAKTKALLESEGLILTRSYDDSIIGEADYLDDLRDKETVSNRKVGLTATEVNDFSKWSLWTRYEKETQYIRYLEMFKIQPSGRYTLQLQSSQNLPIANAEVTLLEDGKEVFSSRTDNTGKAELWNSITKKLNPEIGVCSMSIKYLGKKYELNRVKPFENGMNHLSITVSCSQNKQVDIAFVFDATGSMGDELSFLQNEMKDIIFNSKKLDDNLQFRYANVFYRDAGDQYIAKKQDFTTVLTEAGNYIDEQMAGGGGDEPEAVEVALETAIDSLNWNTEARARLLFLILDAPPHQTPEIASKLQNLVTKAAKLGIRIIPIGASGIQKPTEFLLRSMALATNGTYTVLTNHSGIGGAHLEPTTDKYDVESLNEMIVRIVQTMTAMPDCQEQIPQVILNLPDSIVQFPEPFVQTITDTSNIGDSTVLVDRDTTFVPELEISWSFYPNPTNGLLNVLSDQNISELFVSDMTGKELIRIENVEANRPKQIDLTEYPTGIYLIRFLNKENKWISGRVILARS